MVFPQRHKKFYTQQFSEEEIAPFVFVVVHDVVFLVIEGKARLLG